MIDPTIVDRVQLGLGEAHRALEARARAFVAASLAPHEDEESDDFARSITRARRLSSSKGRAITS